MGCYPVGFGALNQDYMRKGQGALQPEGASYADRTGGPWRQFPLLPPDYKGSLEESMDIEIRRAMRMGLDGLAVDVLAGQQSALASIDALFKVAEEKKYPFQITFCLDNPKQNVEAVRHLMEKHGKSPNLARRDGKVLLLGYRSHRIGERLHPELSKADWAKPESIRYYGEAIKELEDAVGEPLWNEDFPGKSQPKGYYADEDGDGLPNWFEMFYFGKLGDFSTATVAKPGDSPSGDGRTNLQAYLSQTNPLKPQTPPAPGTVWDLLKNPIGATGVSTNPEADAEGRRLWRYLSSPFPGQWELLGDASISPPRKVKPAVSNAISAGQAVNNSPMQEVMSVAHSNRTRNAFAPVNSKQDFGQVVYRWVKLDENSTEYKRTVALYPIPGVPVAVEWTSPANGSYQVEINVDRTSGSDRSNFQLKLVGFDGKELWQAPLDATNPSAQASLKVALKAGQCIRLEVESTKPRYSSPPEVTRFEIMLEK